MKTKTETILTVDDEEEIMDRVESFFDRKTDLGVVDKARVLSILLGSYLEELSSMSNGGYDDEDFEVDETDSDDESESDDTEDDESDSIVDAGDEDEDEDEEEENPKSDPTDFDDDVDTEEIMKVEKAKALKRRDEAGRRHFGKFKKNENKTIKKPKVGIKKK